MTESVAAAAAASSSDADCHYGECYLRPFSSVYDKVHIPLSIIICVFGAVSNIINVIVLTSFAFPWSYPVAVYRLVNVNCNVVFHTIAFTHTIAVALFRFGALKWPIVANRYVFRWKLAIGISVFLYLVVPFVCTPVFFTSTVRRVGRIPDEEKCCPLDSMYDLSYSNNVALVSAVFWGFGICLKLFPCAALVFLLIGLIRSLKRMERHRKTTLSRPKSRRRKRIISARTRTTRMLTAVLLLCVVVEFPHGILNLCTAIYGETFGVRIYDHVGSFMEMLTLLYSSVSFILYCTTSDDFLRTFRKLFLAPLRRRKTQKLNAASSTKDQNPDTLLFGAESTPRSVYSSKGTVTVMYAPLRSRCS
ncbi:Protein EGL-6 b [Aphelenchoides avenae]|nr:Protein EGL-6 b [Aphelenchus avenae]